MPREIEMLTGPGLASTRWTSTSGVWGARAPFAGRGMGCVGPNCGCGCSMEGLGSIYPQIVRSAKQGEDPRLDVSMYVTSRGPLDPTRTVVGMLEVLRSLSYGVKDAPTAKAYPLTWVWDYDAPNKVYQARVTGDAAGPFVKAVEGLGPILDRTPTAADSAQLASAGTVMTFSKVVPPANADLNQLLGALRERQKTATNGSNVQGGSQPLIYLYSVPRSNPLLVAGGWGLGLVLAWNMLQTSAHVSRNR